MNAVNLYVLTREVNADIREEYEFALSSRAYPIKYRLEEIELMRAIVNSLKYYKAPPITYDGWFYAFSIPQISKEFDLIRIGKNAVINIELKSQFVEHNKVSNQMNQNRYYLSHLQKKVFSFLIMPDVNGIIRLFKYHENLEDSSYHELIEVINIDSEYCVSNIEKLFDPSLFLVSPINSPKRFLNKEYFLNNHQQEIKRRIINAKSDEQLFGIKGSAGTGKTLLLYDIAFSFGEIKRTCIIHGGLLSEGHIYLNERTQKITIISAKEATEDKLKSFDVICVDESQRIYTEIIDMLLELSKTGKTCIFAYDYKQALSKAEISRNIPKRLSNMTNFQEFILTDHIRTNKEIFSFIRAMIKLTDLPKGRVSYDCIDILYANSIKEADSILKLYIEKGYKFITITPSQYVFNQIDHYSNTTNSHQIIGQEFDNVVVIIDTNFRYDDNGVLQGKEHPNPDYLFARLFYQNITRARKRLCVLVLNNPDVFTKLIRIKNQSLT